MSCSCLQTVSRYEFSVMYDQNKRMVGILNNFYLLNYIFVHRTVWLWNFMKQNIKSKFISNKARGCFGFAHFTWLIIFHHSTLLIYEDSSKICCFLIHCVYGFLSRVLGIIWIFLSLCSWILYPKYFPVLLWKRLVYSS